MPAKMARSAPRPPFGLPELTVAVRTSLLSCRKPENHEYSSQFGSHPGNPGLYVQMMFLPQRQRYQQEAPSKRGC
jgi:hypothetical protein